MVSFLHKQPGPNSGPGEWLSRRGAMCLAVNAVRGCGRRVFLYSYCGLAIAFCASVIFDKMVIALGRGFAATVVWRGQ
jgi:hypothetical protein